MLGKGDRRRSQRDMTLVLLFSSRNALLNVELLAGSTLNVATGVLTSRRRNRAGASLKVGTEREGVETHASRFVSSRLRGSITTCELQLSLF